jgi:hypothetical protein
MCFFDTVLGLLNSEDQAAILNLIGHSDAKKKFRLDSVMYDAFLFEGKHVRNSKYVYACASIIFALKMVENDNQNSNQFYDFTYYIEFAILEFELRLYKMRFSELYSDPENYLRTEFFGGDLWNFVRNLNEKVYYYLLYTFLDYRDSCLDKLQYKIDEERNLYSNLKSKNRTRSFRIQELANLKKIKFKYAASAVVHYIKHSHECIRGQHCSPFHIIRASPGQYQNEANYPCRIISENETYEEAVVEGQFQGSGPVYFAHIKRTVLNLSDPICLVSYRRISINDKAKRKPRYN